MKIAATYNNGQINQHFGQTQQFKVYEIEGSEVKSAEVIGTGDASHCGLGGFLGQQGIDALICGGIGPGAVNALSAAGVQLYGGVSGDPDAAVEALIKGDLQFQTNSNCNHDHGGHHHHGDHQCNH